MTTKLCWIQTERKKSWGIKWGLDKSSNYGRHRNQKRRNDSGSSEQKNVALRNNLHIILKQNICSSSLLCMKRVGSLSVLIHTNYKINKFQLWDYIICRWKQRNTIESCRSCSRERRERERHGQREAEQKSLVRNFDGEFRDRHATLSTASTLDKTVYCVRLCIHKIFRRKVFLVPYSI